MTRETDMEKTYQWNAADYASHSAAQQEWAMELINKLRLFGNEALLDIGCGDGKVSAAVADVLPYGFVLAIDNSPNMIDLAKGGFPPAKHPNLSFLLLDARKMAFSSQFDVVFSNAALHWIIDHGPILHRIRAGLVKGGRLVCQMGGKGNAKGLFDLADILVTENRWKEYFYGFSFPYRFYGAEEYKALLREAGLGPLRVELIPKVMKQKGKEGLAGWVRTTWLPYTERVPAHLTEALISELVERYVKDHPLDEDGMVSVNMVRLEVEAVGE